MLGWVTMLNLIAIIHDHYSDGYCVIVVVIVIVLISFVIRMSIVTLPCR